MLACPPTGAPSPMLAAASSTALLPFLADLLRLSYAVSDRASAGSGLAAPRPGERLRNWQPSLPQPRRPPRLVQAVRSRQCGGRCARRGARPHGGERSREGERAIGGVIYASDEAEFFFGRRQSGEASEVSHGRGQTDEPKQTSHQKNVHALFFLVVGDFI